LKNQHDAEPEVSISCLAQACLQSGAQNFRPYFLASARVLCLDVTRQAGVRAANHLAKCPSPALSFYAVQEVHEQK